ncbi:hypothetical protein ACFL1A_03430 [Patescibacteria group bacterium]
MEIKNKAFFIISILMFALFILLFELASLNVPMPNVYTFFGNIAIMATSGFLAFSINLKCVDKMSSPAFIALVVVLLAVLNGIWLLDAHVAYTNGYTTSFVNGLLILWSLPLITVGVVATIIVILFRAWTESNS